MIRTYLFADLRDYTAFVETRGDTAATRLIRSFRSLFRAEIRSSRGAEVKTEGDSFYVVFRTPGDAVRCALGVMRGARRHSERHSDFPLRCGIGINTGEAVEHEKGYVGSAVILAARLASQAEAGRILITDTVRSLIRTGAVAPMRDLGTWKLKNVAQAVHVYEVETVPTSAAASQGPALRIPALLLDSPIRSAGGILVSSELVQREKPLQALVEHLAAAARGESRFVALTGEAGVGKSRLARELARVAHDDGFYVFGGRSHASAAVPYEPLVAALRPYAQARGTEILRRLLGSLLVELRRLLPELDAPAPISAATPPDEERQERFHRVMQLLLEDAASLRPVLLVLEDMHEADAATRDLIRYLASSLHGSTCVVLTYRDEDVGVTHPLRALLADLDRDHRLARVTVEPLDFAGVERMTQALLPERATDALARSVFERSEGVPFFVEELLKTAMDDPEARPDQLPLPRTVRDSVQVRVSRLAHARPGAIELLEAAAIAGTPLEYDMLVRLAGRTETEAADDIFAFVDAQLLERPPTHTEIYQFRHTLTRDAIADAIPLSRRRRLHRRIAETIEALGPSSKRAGALATHFGAAGDVGKALRYAREGADAASAVGAYATATDLLRQAVAYSAGTGEEAAVREELAASLRASGRAGEAEESLLAARDLLHEPRDIARIDIALAAALRMQGRRSLAIEAVKRAIATLEREPAGETLARALVTHAELAWAENDLQSAAELARRSLVAGQDHYAAEVIVTALTVLGGALTRIGDAEGLAHLQEAIRLGRSAGLVAETVNAHFELSKALTFRGNAEGARRAADEGLALARTAGLEFAQARLLAHMTTISVNQGRYGEARGLAEQAVALARPGTIASASARISLAHVLANVGEYQHALALFDQLISELERTDPDRRMILYAYRAQALVGLGRLDEAQSSADTAVDIALGKTGMGMTAFLNAADVAEAKRDATLVHRLTTQFESYFAGRETGPVRAVRAELAAILDRCEGRDASAAFAATAELWASLGAAVRASYRRACAAIAQVQTRPKRASAMREIRAMRSDLMSRAALRYVDLIDAALKRAPALRTRTTPLSDRQMVVARLISRGLTDRRIAKQLRVSAPVATRLTAAVRRQLGVTTRAQVAAWVLSHEVTAPAERV